MKVAAIDGDLLIYRGCFAAEHTEYTLTGDWGTPIKFRYKKDLKEYVEKNKIENYEIISEQVVEPLEHALHLIKNIILSIQEKLKPEHIAIYLSGKDNFRKKVAITLPYKGNRDKTKKPHWMKEAREYLESQWGALVIDGFEADDALGVESEVEGVIVCSTDKDLDQLPGWHYNFVEEKLYQISELEGWRNFYKQMLTGDRTDNIAGIDGCGPVMANNLLGHCTTKNEMMAIAFEEYKVQFKDNASQRWEENWALLYVCRNGNDLTEVEARANGKNT